MKSACLLVLLAACALSAVHVSAQDAYAWAVGDGTCNDICAAVDASGALENDGCTMVPLYDLTRETCHEHFTDTTPGFTENNFVRCHDGYGSGCVVDGNAGWVRAPRHGRLRARHVDQRHLQQLESHSIDRSRCCAMTRRGRAGKISSPISEPRVVCALCRGTQRVVWRAASPCMVRWLSADPRVRWMATGSCGIIGYV